MALSRKEVLKEFRRLEKIIETQGNELVNLQIELERATSAGQEMGEAALNLRDEEVNERLDYKETNTELLKFVEKVASSHSKFRKEARSILGL